ncbi:MAG: succinate dehydrogenase cytochrome b subunit [Chitinophagales bacterium]
MSTTTAAKPSVFFQSSIGKKVFMALTGLFLITFLIVHCAINAMVFYNDGGVTFSKYAHFMGTNPIIRIMEIGLVAGFLIHIVDGLLLYFQNRAARPVKYAKTASDGKTTWYSRSMALLGTIILLFLVVHTAHFWIPNRAYQFLHGEELNLFTMMQLEFQEWYTVVIYLLGCFSLFWHLLHGFGSAFQTMGWNHVKYNQVIHIAGVAFSIIVPLIFASMPLAFFFQLVK